jgi:ABC-2 type transport system ATP-binding protein
VTPSLSPDSPALKCCNLRKEYEGRGGFLRKRTPSVVAVDHLNLTIRRGECFGLLGPNGSGKTTTVEMLEGLLEPTAGQVELLGLSWQGNERQLRERVGVALQETHLPEKLTVEETLTLFRSFYPKPRPLTDLLDEVELGEKRQSFVGKLSGGQRQRLAIACSLVGEPEVLFLDEPTTGLDPQSRRQIWGLVSSYRSRGGTIIITTHYMEEAERLCDRVAIVDHGKLVREGAPDVLIATLPAPHVIELEVEPKGSIGLDEWRMLAPVREAHLSGEGGFSLAVNDPEHGIPTIIDLVEKKGLKLIRLSTRKASLEDVFVALTGRHLRDD